jgi:1-acyl-sn-glycerol-3-phosphate acyltransferase
MVRLARRMRKKLRIKGQQLQDVHVKGLENLTQAHREGCGILITPNHSSHADPFTMYAAADEAGLPLQFMATWHVFSARSLPCF